MKTFKVVCAATVLALSLSIPVFADDPKPSDVHEPGRSCVSEIPGDASDTGSAELSVTDDSDFSLWAVVDLLSTVF